MVVVEDLGEEGPEGEGGAEESIAEGGVDLSECVVDLFFGEVLGEGEAFGLLELSAGGGDLACGDEGVRMAHDGLRVRSAVVRLS
jgi:hypothetical protein